MEKWKTTHLLNTKKAGSFCSIYLWLGLPIGVSQVVQTAAQTSYLETEWGNIEGVILRGSHWTPECTRQNEDLIDRNTSTDCETQWVLGSTSLPYTTSLHRNYVHIFVASRIICLYDLTMIAAEKLGLIPIVINNRPATTAWHVLLDSLPRILISSCIKRNMKSSATDQRLPLWSSLHPGALRHTIFSRLSCQCCLFLTIRYTLWSYVIHWGCLSILSQILSFAAPLRLFS